VSQIRYIRADAGKPPNPLLQLLGLVAGVAVFVISVFIGGIILAGLVGFVLLTMLVIYVRVWWISRQLRAAQRERAGPGGRRDTVDAEYHVVDISDPDEPTHRQSGNNE